MVRLFGEAIRCVGFFRFARFEFGGFDQVIARSGYSGQGGFEIYLRDAALGEALWDAVLEAGAALRHRPRLSQPDRSHRRGIAVLRQRHDP